LLERFTPLYDTALWFSFLHIIKGFVNILYCCPVHSKHKIVAKTSNMLPIQNPKLILLFIITKKIESVTIEVEVKVHCYKIKKNYKHIWQFF